MTTRTLGCAPDKCQSGIGEEFRKDELERTPVTAMRVSETYEIRTSTKALARTGVLHRANWDVLRKLLGHFEELLGRFEGWRELSSFISTFDIMTPIWKCHPSRIVPCETCGIGLEAWFIRIKRASAPVCVFIKHD